MVVLYGLRSTMCAMHNASTTPHSSRQSILTHIRTHTHPWLESLLIFTIIRLYCWMRKNKGRRKKWREKCEWTATSDVHFLKWQQLYRFWIDLAPKRQEAMVVHCPKNVRQQCCHCICIANAELTRRNSRITCTCRLEQRVVCAALLITRWHFGVCAFVRTYVHCFVRRICNDLSSHSITSHRQLRLSH